MESIGESIKESPASYIVQERIEEADNQAITGKSVNDVVIISLDLKGAHNLLDVSTIYQLTTEAGSGQQIPTQQTPMKYFLRIERRLQRAKDQESFVARHESLVVLRSFIQLMLISINKMKIIQQQKEHQA